MQSHDRNGIYYELDDTNFTAKVIQSPLVNGSIIIPRSFKHRNQDYVITTIGEGSFKDNKNLVSVGFSEDSELQIIEKEAFFGSFIEKLSLPATVKEFKEGWCSFTSKLTNIEVSPENPYCTTINNDIIVGKSSDNAEVFDLLIFVRRNLQKLIIPSTIKRICAFSFNDCYNIKAIYFNKDSQLESIDNCAFLYSSIESIQIPATVQKLNKGWCNGTSKLVKFEISPGNKIFEVLSQKIIITRSTKFEKKCDIVVFACRNLEKAVIPPYIKEIASYAFSGCQYLKTVEFSKGSKLSKIDDFAFSFSSIENILIPQPIKIIGERSFFGCNKLKEVRFEKEAKIDLIKKEAFAETSLEEIALPEDVNELEEGWCSSKTKGTLIAPDYNYEYFYPH